MVDYRNLLFPALATFLLPGCGAILNANFENNKYQGGVSPDGLIPGGPSGDRVNVTGGTIGAGAFTIDVRQFGAATLGPSGDVFPNTKGAIEGMDRIGLWCLGTSDDAAFAGYAYMIDGVVVREK